ncbi:hypothetical protein C7H85_05815 [Zobellella endophytica]|uniref:Uncharacterized protein n=1 Tax=Zobellella endophytica TaxID=2116700 RepID=A0A2P7R7G9_9GAMM|nr:hypothetical protein [Zobellella endophytica]PSJ46161.1 hypothetical protein C7H85_05815 [Zobellella endophytica]
MPHWQQDFIWHFRLRPDSSRLRLVVARAPYAHRLGTRPLAVSGQGATTPYYRETDNVAMLVADWARMETGMEVILSLLAGGPQRGWAIAAWLAKHRIAPLAFADYLYAHFGVLLANRRTRDGDQKARLQLLLSTEPRPVSLLFAGDEACQDFFDEQTPAVPFGVAIHPGSADLGLERDAGLMLHHWYRADDQALLRSGPDFSLRHFRVLAPADHG